MFCEAIKVDMANSKDSSFKNTKTSTLSLITVLFEDLCEAITIYKDFCGEMEVPQPSISLLNKTGTFDGYEFNIDIITDEVNTLQKELLTCLRVFCIFGYRESYINLLCILMEQEHTWKQWICSRQTFGHFPFELSKNQKSYESPSGCP